MKIATIFASNRSGGKNEEIKQMLLSLPFGHEYDFIEMSSINIEPCLDCKNCSYGTICKKDDFSSILNRLVKADINLIVVPAYSPYPSKFVALMEKLLRVSYLNNDKPLKNKKTAIFYYCSACICDETQLKILWQKFLMDNYSFEYPNYPYLNKEKNPNSKYNKNVKEYVKDIVTKISKLNINKSN